uniref:Cyclic GMP-AMP synthase-like n=1 Tax=Lepisosteus oculatus TaxID=7918 RepID=W5LZH8_LEPOC
MDFLKNNEEQPYFRDVTKLTTGSYYEMVKIHNPNEFDVMLLLPAPRLELTELRGFSGLYYQLAVVRAPRTPLRAFLLPDGRSISATRILQDTRGLVKTFLRTYRGESRHASRGRWLMDRKRASCPAVTLTLHSPEAAEPISLDIVPTLEVPAAQGWPGAARGGLCVQDWLGKKARRHFISQALYFVPKQPPGRQRGEEAKGECGHPCTPCAPALSVWTPLYALRPSSLSVDTPVPPAPQVSQCGHPCTPCAPSLSV